MAPKITVVNLQKVQQYLAMDRELKGETLRVLLLLLSQLDFENWIQITQKKIGETLEIKKQNVSKAILLLEKKGIILRGPKLDRTYVFRLNSDFGWKGKVKNLNEYRRDKFDDEQKEFIDRFKSKKSDKY